MHDATYLVKYNTLLKCPIPGFLPPV